MIRPRAALLLALAAPAAACKDEPPPAPVYQAVPVETRDIVVSAQAAGTIQPDTVVEVKSKASGEILDIRVETGQLVRAGELMILVDPRQPRNALAQAEAELEVARARLANATAQKNRADELFKTQSITETEHEQALLDFANARAEVVRAEIAVQNARDQLQDTRVVAPITGTIISKSVERGQVISSPTRDVGGGTVLLKMANLNLVQVRTLVDETDIGKIQPGMRATVTVDAYPNRPFEGRVLKIEPQAETQQNVTMFPVLVRIDNPEGLLRPGMNCEVEIHVGRREGVLAVPNAALRTERDVASAAEVLGLDPAEVQRQLAEAGGAGRDTAAAVGARPAADSIRRGNTMTTPDGRTITLPDGVTESQVRAIFAKFRNGEAPTPSERAILQRLRGAGGEGTRRARGAAPDARFGGRYIVFALRQGRPVPVGIRTGLTDLDYAEVVEGLAAGDSVLILPSAGLVRSQREFQERVNRMTGGGGLPGMTRQDAGQGGTRPPGGGR